MTVVLFESHSTSLDNEAGLASGHFDVALSPTGERQAREMGDRYRDTEIAAVFSSDLQRSYRTAEIAFGGRGIPIERDRRLRECDYGELTRRPRSEVVAQPLAHLDKPFPGGESYRDAAQRMREFLKELVVRFDENTVLIVGHRASQVALEHWLNGRRLEDVLTAPWSWQPGWKYQLDSSKPWT